MVLAAVIEGMTLVAFIAIFNGGYARRQNGWKILSLLLFLIGNLLSCICQAYTDIEGLHNYQRLY
jgi:hypothetical protein